MSRTLRFFRDPTHSFSVDIPLEFVRAAITAYDVQTLFFRRAPLDLSKEWMESEVRSFLLSSHVSATGISLTFASTPRKEADSVSIGVNFGLNADCLSSRSEVFFVDLPTARVESRGEYLRAVELMEHEIAILDPYAAELQDSVNDYRMDAYEISNEVKPEMRPGGREEPVLISALTYLRGDLVDAFGGVSHVSRCPAHKVRPVHGGLLVDLLGEFFDDSNAEHREAQLKAMRHLALPTLDDLQVS